MEISGLVKTSLIDYPGKVAAVVFTQGCNFRCGFCHNPDLIPIQPKGSIDESEVVDYIHKRSKVLDGVVVTGGEPMLQKDLLQFLKIIKEAGLAVKLDTNGSNPEMLKTAINEDLVDYIAMDIKGDLDSYKNICGYNQTKNIVESIKIIKNSGKEYEFRTTVLPYYHRLEDFQKIGLLLAGASRYTVQGFRPQITLVEELETEKPFSRQNLTEIAEIMRNYVKEVVIHDNLS